MIVGLCNHANTNRCKDKIVKLLYIVSSQRCLNVTNLSAAVIPAGINLRDLYARAPMITASVPLDATITRDYQMISLRQMSHSI